MDKDLQKEKEYLNSTLELVGSRLSELKQSSKKLEGVFDESNEEYFDYLKHNANKINEEDVVELVNMQGRLDDLQQDTIDYIKQEKIYNKMLDKPYFSSIVINENNSLENEKYYIGINSLIDDNKLFKVVDWRSPIASIFYDYEQGQCEIKTNSSILRCNLLNKRQYGISLGQLNFYFDTTINIEDDILKTALASSTSDKMKSIVQTIQREQNAIIRGDENKNLIVQGVAGSGKTAIALHRIAYLLYKMKGKINSSNLVFISPNNAFSSYISSVLPDLAEDDIEKLQLDLIARKLLKKHLILERKYEQIERLINTNILDDFNYKTSYQFLLDLLDYANKNYIDNFHIDNLIIKDIEIDVNKIYELFFHRYSDRDLFTR
ncbi:MAG: UvrD-helicase domain-containing protein, partial [Christensenellales bacterium]